MRKKKSIKEIKEYFIKSKAEMLTFDFIIKIFKFKCKCGNEDSITRNSVNRIIFNNGRIICKSCIKVNMSERKKKESKKKLLNKFKNISILEIIHGVHNGERLKIKFICPICGEKAFIRYKDNMKELICRKCVLDCLSRSRRLSEKLIKKLFAEYGAILLSEYKNNMGLLKFKCQCGNIDGIIFTNLKDKGIVPRCRECKLKYSYLRGENHPFWNPNLTKEDRGMSKYGRGNKFKQWSNFLLKFYRYKCVMSEAKHNFSVHHLNAWSKYKDQRYAIFNGVVISKEIHDEFHKIYGRRGNTTLEDFKNFYRKKMKGGFEIPENVYSEIVFSGGESKNLLNRKKSFDEMGINYIPLFQSEIILKPSIMSSILRSKIGKLEYKLYARKLKVKIIEDGSWKDFLDKSHRQGKIISEIALGLYTKENELVSAMVFGKPRFGQYDYELLRFASKLNYLVVGGASKLFKHFIRNYDFNSIVSYADIRFSNFDPDKTVYPKLGFKYSHRSNSNYWYTKDGINLYSRINFQKHKLKDKLEKFDPEFTEHQNMMLNGYQRLYDCGNHVFVYKR